MSSEKPEGTYRIFVMGSSAAMGEPEPAFGFARMLQAMLEETYAGVRFDVVNTAMTAINSHVVVSIARDCARFDPDLFVVYMGNNEVVGPYGAGSTLKSFSPNLQAIRASIWLRSLRLGQVIEGSLGMLSGAGEPPAEWRGMEMFMNNRVAADDPRMETVYSHFRANLESIVNTANAAGARMVLSTVASNLRDNPPFASLHRNDLSEADLRSWQERYDAAVALEDAADFPAAAERYQEASRLDDRYADLHYRLARCLYRLGRFDDARSHFVLARDLDVLRFRADTSISEVIRETGRRLASRGVVLVDAERAFDHSGLTQHGIPGEELFYEHVHMTPEGNHELAQAVFREITSILPGWITQRAGGSPSPPSLERCSERIALTTWDRAKMLMKMLDLEERPPFTNQIDHATRMEKLRREGSEAAAEKHPAAAVERQAQIYQRALERWPDDLFFRAAYAALLRLRGEPDSAVQQWQLLLKEVPDTVAWLREMGRALLDANRAAESAEAYQRAIDVSPGRAEFLLGLGIALDRQGKTPEAIEAYRETVRMDPGLVAGRLNLGMILEEQGKGPEAMEQYREAVRVQPGHAQARLSLARALSASGDTGGALESFAEAVKLDPKLAEARLGLARSLAATGRTGEAIQRYRDILDLRPDWEPALDGLALILAASENAADRNGLEAVALSEKACRQTRFEVPQFLDTLAAAYAEAGKFDQARRAAERGIQMALSRKNEEAAERIRSHMMLFDSGRPLRIRSFDGRL